MSDKASIVSRRLVLLTGASALFAGVNASAADPWPSKPLRIIVGFAPGSSPDVQARMLAEPLAAALGSPVIVENKPGASANIGADAVAKAQDEHTIGVIGNGPLTSSQFLFAKLPYDPAKDFVPLAMIGSAPLVWVIAKLPAGTSSEQFIAQARAQGDKMAYGSVGHGSGTHLGMELLKQALGINPLHVPFNGGPAVLTNLLGGQIQMALLPVSTAMPMVQAGKLEALAVVSAKRSPLAPTVPSMEDLGVKGVNIEVWNAVMAPSTMPAAHQARLSAALQKILSTREIQQKLFLQGWKVDDTSPKGLTQRIKQDRAIYGDVIAKNNIKLE